MWVRLDDSFSEHPKVVRLGDLQPLAISLFVVALCWANRQLTDGRLPKALVASLWPHRYWVGKSKRPIAVGDLADALVAVGLWKEAGDDYEINDYLTYQPSRDEVLAKRKAVSEVRRRAGKKGLDARWGAQLEGSTVTGLGKSDGKRPTPSLEANSPVPGTEGTHTRETADFSASNDLHPEARRFLDVFAHLYRQNRERPYIGQRPRDLQILSELLSLYGFSRLLELSEAMLGGCDVEWVAGSDCSLPVLKQAASQLEAHLTRAIQPL